MDELKLVDFETAKKLKELNFPQEFDDAVYCIRDCDSDEGDWFTPHEEGELVYYPSGFSPKDIISAPSLELVKKWLFEKCDFFIMILPNYNLDSEEFILTRFSYDIKGRKLDLSKMSKRKEITFSTNPDDALESAIKECLDKLEKNS